MKNLFLVLAFFFALSGKAQQEKTPFEDGKILFQRNCARCHGYDGKLGQHGAKNLQASKLDDRKLVKIISNGKWFMPKWKKVLTAEQISAVIAYIKTLRVN